MATREHAPDNTGFRFREQKVLKGWRQVARQRLVQSMGAEKEALLESEAHNAHRLPGARKQIALEEIR